jgi:hypothetical protein
VLQDFPYAGVVIKPLSRMPLLGLCREGNQSTEQVGCEWKTDLYAVRLAAIPTMGTLVRSE